MPAAYPAIFIMGPTASGKTDLAVELCRHLPVEIISVDSAMVYRGLDIGTAKPEPEVLAKAPHRLIDICDPAESYSAADFARDALLEMQRIQEEGRIPLLVGGTFLYFRALASGLSPLPNADPQIRAQLEEEASACGGWQQMHQRLSEIDPESAGRIHPNDPQRIQRALEIYYLSGKTMTQLFAEETPRDFPYQVQKILLMPEERSVLHKRIELRFKQMLQQGLVEEVIQLFQRADLNKNLPAIRAVGYRQVWEFLEGEYDEQTLLHKGVVATRQLAKRQLTWLRSEKNGEIFDPLIPENIKKILKNLINNPNYRTK